MEKSLECETNSKHFYITTDLMLTLGFTLIYKNTTGLYNKLKHVDISVVRVESLLNQYKYNQQNFLRA